MFTAFRLTVTTPVVTVRLIGPVVDSEGLFTHSQLLKPTKPTFSPVLVGSGVIPMSIGSTCNAETADETTFITSARDTGVGGTSIPGAAGAGAQLFRRLLQLLR
ncbi:hypothetical protein ATN37_02240 [Rhodococcus sp. MH15]|nr:hypothetical protein [Rhodococcus sp. MH15]